MVLFHPNLWDWWLCKNNPTRTGSVWEIYIYLSCCNREKFQPDNALPIVSVTSNHTFFFYPRPPVRIHTAALRKRTELVQPHPEGRLQEDCSGKTRPQDHKRNMEMEHNSKVQEGIRNRGGHTYPLSLLSISQGKQKQKITLAKANQTGHSSQQDKGGSNVMQGCSLIIS